MTEPTEGVPAALSAMLERDRATRARLVASGTLFDGYAPEMEAVHAENARALEAILDAHGWPGLSLAGRDGSIAAWTVALHAIGMPAFQRRCLALLERAAEEGEVPPAFVAMMEDRIRFNERRPQRYGTIFDWDGRGRMVPWTIEDPAGVDARRAAVGLRPMEDEIRKVRRAPRERGDAPPKDPAARQRAIDAWALRTGWITDGSCSPGTPPGPGLQATGPS